MRVLTAHPIRAIRLRDGVHPAAGQDGRVTVAVGGASLPLPALAAGSRTLLLALADRDVAEADARQQVITADGMDGLLRWQAAITRLDTAGLLERSVLTEDGPVARLRPTGLGARAGTAAQAPAVVKLSRFTLIRAVDGQLASERPGGHAVVELGPAVAGVLGGLAQWTQLSEGVGGLSAELARPVVDLLAGPACWRLGDPRPTRREPTPRSPRGIRRTSGCTRGAAAPGR